MSRIKTSCTVNTIANWMGQTVIAGDPVPLDQVGHWQKALRVAMTGLEARELACELLENQKDRIRDRVPAAYAEQLLGVISQATKRLAYLAEQAASLKELDQIDQDACAIIAYFELLAFGVVRPAGGVGVGSEPEADHV